MRRLLLIALAIAGCKSGPSNGYAVDLTVTAGKSVMVSSIVSLEVDVSGDETASHTYPLDHAFNEERFIYTPLASSDNLTIAVFARDAGNAPVAYGETTVKLKHGATVTTQVILGTDIPPPDMAISDMGMPDLVGDDLTGVDQATGDLSSSDLLPSADLSPTQLLTVTKAGAALSNGLVKTSANEINCGSTCSASFGQGAMVTLTASVVPKTGTWFSGWSGDCAANNQPTCTLTMSAARNVTATFDNVNYVFVTSTSTALPLGANGAASLTKADVVCNQLASGKLPGTYKAWMSVAGDGTAADPHVDAKDRFGSARGWVRPDDLPFGDDVPSFVDGAGGGKVYFPPRVTESLVTVSTSTVAASGTNNGGTQTGNCSDWTSASGTSAGGDPNGGSSIWVLNGSSSFNCAAIQFYCFGIDYTEPLTAPKTAGRVAFISTTVFDPSSGIGTADSNCRTEAMTAGLPNASATGSYLAMMATSTPSQSAASRFDITSTSLPWVRADGIPLAATAADLFDSNKTPFAALNVHSDGVTYSAGGTAAWTGASAPSAMGTDATTCANWTGAGTGQLGYPNEATSSLFAAFGPTSTCTTAESVYCLQK